MGRRKLACYNFVSCFCRNRTEDCIDKRFIRINDRIRAREIRVIDDEGNQLGILPPYEAIKKAREKRSEEHTSELQSRFDLVCRLLLEKKKKKKIRQLVLRIK